MDSSDRRRSLRVSPISPCSCQFGIFYPGNYFSIPHRIARRDGPDIVVPSMVSKSDIVNSRSFRGLRRALSRRYGLVPVEDAGLIFFVPRG